MGRRCLRFFVFGIGVMIAFSGVWAEVMTETVEFEVLQETFPGTSVFITGNIDELGAGNPLDAVKMQPYNYPVWRLNVDIPLGTDFTYQFALREDSPEEVGDPMNFQLISELFQGATGTPPPGPGYGKTFFYHSGWDTVYLMIKNNEDWVEYEMTREGPGRTPEEYLYRIDNVGEWDSFVEFKFRNESGVEDIPTDADTYYTQINGVFVQDGHLFNYVPPETVSDPRIETIPDFYSAALDNTREVRILLPRGYDQNPSRHYPVLYMHDGQNVFEPGGPYGCWFVDLTSERLIRLGRMRETIIVAVDNMGEERMREYKPPCSEGGIADQYAAFLYSELKPHLDSVYRTLTGPEDTATMGSSMGGLVSAYLTWTFPEVFGHAGCVSPWFVHYPELIDRFESESPPNTRFYLDSGNAGYENDGMWGCWNARDSLLHRGYSLNSDLLHWIDYGAIHNEEAWAARVHIPLIFMLDIFREHNVLEPGQPTPTPRPTSSPTPSPTNTPSPPATPSPHENSPTPDPHCSELGCTIDMPSQFFTAGDTCYCDLHICNPSDNTFENLPVFAILDLFGEYFFAPSFSNYDHFTTNITPGTKTIRILPVFQWPEDAGEISGARWYGAMTNAEITQLLGSLGTYEFGWSS